VPGARLPLSRPPEAGRRAPLELPELGSVGGLPSAWIMRHAPQAPFRVAISL
jgi:hypothetical protein